VSGTAYFIKEDGAKVSFPIAPQPLEFKEVEKIVEEIPTREGFQTVVRVCESLQGSPGVRLWDGSENNATILWPASSSYGSPEDYAAKMVLGLYFDPTPRNLELFYLLHELGHIKDMERKGARRYYCLSAAEDQRWRGFTNKRLGFHWLRYIGQIAYMLLPLERQATKYALGWMKDYARLNDPSPSSR